MVAPLAGAEGGKPRHHINSTFILDSALAHGVLFAIANDWLGCPVACAASVAHTKTSFQQPNAHGRLQNELLYHDLD